MTSGQEGNDLARLTGVAACTDAAAISIAPGAYLIRMAWSEPVAVRIATLPPTILPAGVYIYAGSAKGPGGLRARIGRHLRRNKPRRWHVDHLSQAATSLQAYPVPGGDECALVDLLLETTRYRFPLPGFGSSDCRHCVSHLLSPAP